MPSTPYVAPFVVFLGFLALQSYVNLPAVPAQLLWLVGVTASIFVFSRRVLDFRVRYWTGSIALGVGVFVLWIGPDLLFPDYRSHWLFSNSLTGSVKAGLPEADRGNLLVLLLRGMRAALVVPIVEELFWRAWLMRWLIDQDFHKIPLGTYAAQAFGIVAILFAVEHGPFWDVGLACGILYNWWMVRTRSLGDLILAHGITNACLSAYVVAAGRWEYW